MCRKLLFVVLVVGFCLISSAHAATIIWVSDNKTPTAAGVAADQAWVDLLTAQGYTVNLNFRNKEGRTLDDTKIAALNAADLIIISRDTNSGDYDDGQEIAQWNGITKPILMLIAQISQSSRWQWINTASTNSAQPTLQAVAIGHPIFKGVALDANNQVSVLTTNSSFVSTADVGNGTLLATRADNGQIYIAEWQAGQVFYAGSGYTAAAQRMLLTSGGTTGVSDGTYNLTPEGEKIFLNAIRYIIGGPTKAYGPAPSNGAVITDTWVSLSWKPTGQAVSHDVYVGESLQDVDAGAANTFRGNQTLTSFFIGLGLPGDPYPAGLVPGTTYYWRIDEVNVADPNSPWKGDVWSFSIPSKKAYNPGPTDGAKYQDRAVTLNWTAGLNAKLHYVYFGDNLDTVSNATTGGTPVGTTTYTPAGPLVKGKTYYWRVDEFDGAATQRGNVWSFTTLSDIAITNPDLIGWWKFDEGYGKKAIDFSGHGNDGTTGGDPRWIEGVMDGALDLNGNDYVAINGVVDDMTGTNITLSAWIKTTQSSEGNVFAANDSASAHPLMFGVTSGNPFVNDGTDTQFPPAINNNQWHMITYVRNGSVGTIYVDGVQVGTYTAAWSKDTITRWSIGQEWDTATPSDFYMGAVDDVRIYNKALTADEVKQLTRGDLLRAWSPSPNNGSTVDVERARQPLTWSPGDKASQHDVYFGLDKAAVVSANATETTGIYRGRQSARSYSPTEALAWGTGPYYWRIDQVNTDGTITTGSVWSFSVANYLVVDDIESYNDLPETDPASNRIYKKWIDGYGTTTNGAMVGNLDVPLTQRSNVHGGGQAMPLSYDNNRKFSEATLALAAGRDWTREGVANLSLWFRGATTNAAEKMYVVLNGTAVVYNNDTTLTQKTGWTPWVIPLQQFVGVNLSNVTSITIGFGTRGNTTVVGGTGQMYFDDIRLYRPATAP